MTRVSGRFGLFLLAVALAAVTAVGGCAARERIAINTGTDSYIHSGADVVLYSDSGRSTETGRLDAAGGWQMAIPTAQTTATPGLLINNSSVANAIEVQDAGTPVWSVSGSGAVSQTGDQSVTGDLGITGELAVAQATAATTATPAVLVNSSAAGSALLEVRKASTPVVQVQNDGDVSVSAGDLEVAAGAARVAAPTAVATATPALVVDSDGVSNLLEVRDAATPVFTVNDGGTVVGNVLQYGSSGERLVASTISMTGTYTVSHGLTTVTWAMCTMGRDPDDDAGDAAHMTVEVSGNVVLAKMWQDDFVTAATEAGVAAHCLVIGTP